MAKFNPILGTSTGSIGDVTLMRRNGIQVARVRVRKIANPRSEGQARQRMIAAAAIRFFSPLASVLETSWQGLKRGKSYSAFLKAALTRGRELMFAIPKAAGWYPVPVQLSQGTMPQPVVKWNADDDEGFGLRLAPTGTSVSETIDSISNALINTYGLSEGDQVTLIAAANDGTGVIRPVWMRFNIDLSNGDDLIFGSFGVSINDREGGVFLDFSTSNNVSCDGLGVIFSRWDGSKWLRSTSEFVTFDGSAYGDYAGDTAYARYLPEWMDAAAVVPVSDVYLNNAAQLHTVSVEVLGNVTGATCDLIATSSNYVYLTGAGSVSIIDGTTLALQARAPEGVQFTASVTANGVPVSGANNTWDFSALSEDLAIVITFTAA